MPETSFSIDARSYSDAMRKLDRKIQSITHSKAFELCRRLAEMGATVARVHFDMDYMDGNDNVEVSVARMRGDKGYKIVARGQSVAFAEFGTGIYAGNGYDEVPAGIDVTPGSWSQKHGSGKFIRGAREYWYYDRKRYVGTIPKMGMYYAEKEIKDNIKKVAGEVFNTQW